MTTTEHDAVFIGSSEVPSTSNCLLLCMSNSEPLLVAYDDTTHHCACFTMCNLVIESPIDEALICQSNPPVQDHVIHLYSSDYEAVGKSEQYVKLRQIHL